MGKLNKFSSTTPKRTNKMSQRTSKTNLKRSKSVRASFKSISTRFLHLKSDEILTTMHKSPSLSSLKENTRSDFKRNYFATNFENIKRTDFNHRTVETILKTPQEINKPLKSYSIMGFKKNKEINLSTPPSSVAPKAAAILQIPIKENCESNLVVYRAKHFNNNNSNSSNNNKRLSEDELQKLHSFQRNTLRLSITSKGRRASIFHSASRLLLFILFLLYYR